MSYISNWIIRPSEAYQIFLNKSILALLIQFATNNITITSLYILYFGFNCWHFVLNKCGSQLIQIKYSTCTTGIIFHITVELIFAIMFHIIKLQHTISYTHNLITCSCWIQSLYQIGPGRGLFVVPVQEEAGLWGLATYASKGGGKGKAFPFSADEGMTHFTLTFC